ncbi:MAG: 50S ribosomal protein L11 methyltransferase [Actinomycetota bacterium]|nr:50S ribosomal protein L11 methyltransferase [Actinomycetota bacterium]
MSATDVVVHWEVVTERAELAAEELWGRGATAVELRPEGSETILVASFPTSAAATTVAGEVGGRTVELSRDWADAWRPYAEEVHVGGLVVAPAWRDVAVSGPTVVRIDPGPCFGSGSHPSTRLILALLAADPPAGARVADVGAGSGILAVAAAVLGAASVQAVDIDPTSAAIVRGNASRNGVAPVVRAWTGSADGLQAPVDVALVNVTAAVQVTLAPAVLAALGPGGRILLAGLLPGQWRHIEGSYPGCQARSLPELDGWMGADLVRRSDR